MSELTDSDQIAASGIDVRAPDASVGSATNLAPKRSFGRVLRKAGLILLVLSIVVIALGRLVSSHAVIPSDVGLSADGFLHGCGERKNCVRSIYVEGGGSPPNREAWQASWRYSGDEAAAMDRIVRIVKSYGGEIRIRKPTYLAAVFKSAIFKFPDDVEFSIDPTHGDIAWRSASRLGKADLEVNANRMSALFSEWNKKG